MVGKRFNEALCVSFCFFLEYDVIVRPFLAALIRVSIFQSGGKADRTAKGLVSTFRLFILKQGLG